MEQQYYKQKKILLVDDEKALLDMVADFLREDGYTQIKTAGTVAAATDAAKTWKPDFAILDVMLPDGDGFSLFERLRAFTEMPVLFLTARGEDEDRLRGLGLGADDYMVKPFLPRELLLRVGIILRRLESCGTARERTGGNGKRRIHALGKGSGNSAAAERLGDSGRGRDRRRDLAQRQSSGKRSAPLLGGGHLLLHTRVYRRLPHDDRRPRGRPPFYGPPQRHVLEAYVAGL